MIEIKEYTTPEAREEGKRFAALIGERMKELREKAALTQTEVAAKMGCQQKDISRWESGRQISAANLYFFCKAIGCSMGEFEDIR